MTSNRLGYEDLALTAVKPGTLQPKSGHFPTPRRRHRSFVSSSHTAPKLRNEGAEIPTDFDGLSVPARLLIAEIAGELQCRSVSNEAGIRSLLSTAVVKLIDAIGALPQQHDTPSEQVLATAGSASSAEYSARRPPPNDTVLRVGPLELDLLDRTAKRGDRRIDLRPREFQLLKYMMQRSDTVLTRATLLTEVWRYKFVPETNLVDVYMSKLRRKVDGTNEAALIRNVRGAGFVLSATPFRQHSTPTLFEGTTISLDESSPTEQRRRNCERLRRASGTAHEATKLASSKNLQIGDSIVPSRKASAS
ncbi:winged helix-turn-helix domain-containing protein [Bradyrhizobium sp. USDA 3364]